MKLNHTACSAAIALLTGVQAAYDPMLAKEAAFLSSIAYCPGDKIASWDCGSACDQHPVLNSSTIVQYNKDRNVLSYVGRLPNKSEYLYFLGPLSRFNFFSS